MRIKFRTWNWREKKMEEGIHWQFICSKDVWASDPDNAINSTIGGLPIFTQWTGLKDKNGVEIYIGDIVKWIDEYKASSQSGISEIIWEGTGFNIKGSRLGFEGEELISWEDIEVIGNIYSNPELLK